MKAQKTTISILGKTEVAFEIVQNNKPIVHRLFETKAEAELFITNLTAVQLKNIGE